MRKRGVFESYREFPFGWTRGTKKIRLKKRQGERRIQRCRGAKEGEGQALF